MKMEISDAKEILGLGDKSSINEINHRYKELLYEWHPDRCRENPEKCSKRTQKIIEAYKAVMAWCCSCEISLTAEDISKNIKVESPEDFWEKKFGHDPMWGYPGKQS